MHYRSLALYKKLKFSAVDFFSKYDQICRKLRKWSHLLKKSLMENAFVFSIFSKELRTWGNVLLTQ